MESTSYQDRGCPEVLAAWPARLRLSPHYRQWAGWNISKQNLSLLTNAQIAESLSLEAETAKPTIQRALRKASRCAHLWPVEAATLFEQKRSLTELTGIGPYLDKLINDWFRKPPPRPALDPIRENFFTLAQAKAILAERPQWKAQLRGDLQMHTEWSDGSGTVAEMAEAASQRGYEYIAITDHGKKLKIAGGINEAELREQGREIGAVNEKFVAKGKKFRVLRSIELNLDLAGNGDMEESIYGDLNIVLGAFHLSLRKTDDQTARYLAALRNPNLHILGHPRGRIYNYRLGLKADWPRVFALAAELDKAVEIDSYPDRQDLSVDLLKLARKSGCKISIGTDAHHPWQLDFIDLGLAAALAARIPKDRILNFMGCDQLLKWASKHRS